MEKVETSQSDSSSKVKLPRSAKRVYFSAAEDSLASSNCLVVTVTSMLIKILVVTVTSVLFKIFVVIVINVLIKILVFTIICVCVKILVVLYYSN